MYSKIVDKYLIHDKLKGIPYTHSKAKVLASIHLFFLILAIASYVPTFFLGHEEEVPLLLGGCIVMLLMSFFRQKGNLVISGNLLAGLIFLVLLSAIPTTGGLYSDNLIWMTITPLTALLFANRKSSFLWTLAFLGVIMYSYNNELIAGNVRYTTLFDGDYYMASYSLFATAVFFIVYIFEKGKEEIIKELRKTNEKLKQTHLQLEMQRDLLVQQTNDLERMSEDLKISNADLEHFAYAASHDLKQPLRVIKSYTRLIEKDLGVSLKEHTKEWMGFIVQSTGRMERLLSDLLSLSRVGKIKSMSEKVNLNDTMVIVSHQLSARIAETGASIQYGKLPTVYAPTSLMSQLFQNFISNGIKFQQEGTTPIIKVEAKHKNDEVIISIQDNGIGIKKESQEQIFSVFQRLHTQDEYEGSGIGLHTCTRIMDSIGKEIWLESEVGVGTTFFFTLPVYQVPVEASGPVDMVVGKRVGDKTNERERGLGY